MNEIETTAPQSKLIAFESRKIRRIRHNEEWFFVVEDVVRALIDSKDAKQYIKRMKLRDPELAKGWVQFVPTLPVMTPGGVQNMACANTEGLFRIIQTIPSPKAEPFKRWLAKVGHERVQEIEDPEKAAQRMRELYKAKGYPEEWIERRMRGIAIREELTDEWKKHGVKESKEYEILTAEIAKAAFGVTPSEHKHLKGLQRENLRDHMTDLELIFSMLGEAATTAITKKEHPQGFTENKKVSKRGGNVAGEARRKLEKETGQKVVSTENYLDKTPDNRAIEEE